MMNKTATLILAMCMSTLSLSQTKDSTDEVTFITYKIKAGDTFNQFAQKYLQQPVDLKEIYKVNQIKSIELLPIGSELNIPRHLLKQRLSKATVMSLSCNTPIRQQGSSNKPLTVGAVITEGAVIEVPAECHVSLLLEDGSVIRLPSSASLKITTLRKNTLEPAPEVRLDLTKGRVELDVQKGRSKSTPFEVRTPISIMGVRGTEFRVGYSPDDQAGQVEVLGGTVQARGRADTKANAITGGLGVPIDGEGKALGIEKLLPPPSFESAASTSGNSPSFVAKLTPVLHANYYVADNANTANLTGNRSSQNLLAPELFIPRLTRQATFYQLSSVSESGLVGVERQYAFCAPGIDKPQRCSAIFDAPLADAAPISFTLAQQTGGTAQTLVSTDNLQAKNGRFAIQGLPIGHYKWTLSYALPQSSDAVGTPTVIKQSGVFELLILSPTTP
jgi:LysM repeat protein